jgi:tetratricopeptide (TPR) repeat protein/predicted aspartyl protease
MVFNRDVKFELSRSQCWLLHSAVLAACCGGALNAHAATTCKRQALDLPVTMAGTRPLFAAKINNQDARLVLDSGAFWSLMSSAAAEEFKLSTHPAPFGLTLMGVGGITTPSVATVKNFTLANIPLSNVDFLVGGSEIGGGAIGLIGQNFLEKWDVEYDLAKGMIRLVRDVDCGQALLAYWLTPGQSYSLADIDRATPSEPHTTASGYLNGVKIRVMFDTGAPTSILSLRAAERAGVKVDSPGVVEAGVASGLGRSLTKAYIAPFSSFKIGDGEEIQHTHLRMAAIGIQSADMLIGADFFLSHRIFVANSQHKIYITYNGGPVFGLAASPSKPESSDSSSGPLSEPDKKTEEPADAAAIARRGEASASRGELQHAIADLDRANQLDPGNAEYLYERGRIHWERKETEMAIADFDLTLERQPDHAGALISRAHLRVAAKDFPAAQADLDRVDRIQAKSANIRLELARTYDSADLRALAIIQYDFWIHSHREDSALSVALNGRCWDRALLGQDLSAALADCDKAVNLSLKGANGSAFDSRGLTRLRLGDYGKSIADYDASLKLMPGNAWSLYGRGVAKIRKMKIEDGQADIAAAVKISPGIAEQFKRRGITP